MAQRGETVTYDDKTYTYVQSRITYNGNNVTYAGSKTLPTAGRVMSTDMTIEPLAQLEEITLTSNQTIAYSGDGDGWNKITVAVPSDIRNQSKEANPSLSDNTVTPDAGYSGLSSVKVHKLVVEGLDATKIVSGQTISIGFTGSPSGITVVTGSYASDASATPGDLLYNKTAYTEDGKITGTIESKTSANVSANGPTVNIPIGYYPSGAQYTVDTASHNTPNISVSEAGLITSTHTQAAGYVYADSATTTMQLSTEAASTITPNTFEQTAVAANKYTTGVIKVAPIPSEYIIPAGTTYIYGPGTTNVRNYLYASCEEATPNFDGGELNLTSDNGITYTSGNAGYSKTVDTSGIMIQGFFGGTITASSVLYNGDVQGFVVKSDDAVALSAKTKRATVTGDTIYIDNLIVSPGKTLNITSHNGEIIVKDVGHSATLKYGYNNPATQDWLRTEIYDARVTVRDATGAYTVTYANGNVIKSAITPNIATHGVSSGTINAGEQIAIGRGWNEATVYYQAASGSASTPTFTNITTDTTDLSGAYVTVDSDNYYVKKITVNGTSSRDQKNLGLSVGEYGSVEAGTSIDPIQGSVKINGGGEKGVVVGANKRAIVDGQTVTYSTTTTVTVGTATVTYYAGDLKVPVISGSELQFPSGFATPTTLTPSVAATITTINGAQIRDASAVHGSGTAPGSNYFYMPKISDTKVLSNGPKVTITNTTPTGGESGDIWLQIM